MTRYLLVHSFVVTSGDFYSRAFNCCMGRKRDKERFADAESNNRALIHTSTYISVTFVRDMIVTIFSEEDMLKLIRTMKTTTGVHYGGQFSSHLEHGVMALTDGFTNVNSITLSRECQRLGLIVLIAKT